MKHLYFVLPLTLMIFSSATIAQSTSQLMIGDNAPELKTNNGLNMEDSNPLKPAKFI
jgi:hypothetical protein